MPKSADDQTIDVDSETDVILSYNGKSDSRYTDSDPVKSTASNSSASGNTKNIMTDENGIKISIEDGTLVGNISAVYVHEGKAEIKGGTFSIVQTETEGRPLPLPAQLL